jgi:Family of unknown function (DUF6519)
MNGDFSRVTFDPRKHYSSVLLQQGRVQLDADANEQAALWLYHLRAALADIIGPYGGPTTDSFKITQKPGAKKQELTDLLVGPGHYYVDGILCENDADDVSYLHQPDLFPGDGEFPLPTAFPFVVYLRVYERLVNAVQDPAIREIALGDNGPDTAARGQVVWQVLTAITIPGTTERVDNNSTPASVRNAWVSQPAKTVTIMARGKQPSPQDSDPCITSPAVRYRGAENQLYRVEIHTGGTAGTATFKWSRDNGSALFPVGGISGDEVTVTTLGRDPSLSLTGGDWVEIADDRYPLRSKPDPLRQVKSVDPVNMLVKLDAAPSADTGQNRDLHPFLRRWDQRTPVPASSGPPLADDNALQVVEKDAADQFIDLEDGVQIQFQASNGTYQRGDYWLIPARTATGDVVWPKISGTTSPTERPPDGVAEHFAPLALVQEPGKVFDLRYVLPRLAQPV